MRVPVSLLKKLVPVSVDIPTLARTLNARVSEVEHIHRFPAREAFRDVVVVALIDPLQRNVEHTRWRTTAGEIVVGDRFDVKAGEKYAAVRGALPDGTRVERREVAGMWSDGALVSEAMLGIGKDAARPLRFAPEVAPGADAWDTLELDDVVLEFDLEPNRPDLFSLLGVARDVAAIWNLPLTEPPAAHLALPRLPTPTLDARTPRARAYLALALSDVTVGPSPQWLQNAVRKLGMRPINNIVDAANLAMFEFGEPMHTFDRARLSGQSIVLRMARDGERITTLDGVERTLTEECLLVCDDERPVAIAGVMGDATSEVHDATKDVLVEVAAFDMAAVRRASRRLALRTEASVRFEKGLPISRIKPAAARLAYLLGQVANARPTGIASIGISTPTAMLVPLDRAYLRARLGMPVEDHEIDRILGALGFLVSPTHVLVPEFRPDIKIPEDLAEEVGRIHGYEHVVADAPRVELVAPKANPIIVAATRARRILTGFGWDEVYLPVWIGDAEVERFELDRASLVSLINPVAENLRHFRPTALPALLEAAENNLKDHARFGLFEVAKVYRRRADGTVEERHHLAGISVGEGLLGVRDMLVELGMASGADVTLSRAGRPHYHPGRVLQLGDWALAGELHPRLTRGLRAPPVAFAVDLEALAALRPATPRYTPPPRFPSMEFDLNVSVGPRVEVARVLAAVPRVPTLAEARVVDVYPLDSGARVTLRFAFNAGDRSLTQEETAARMDEVKAGLAGAGFAV